MQYVLDRHLMVLRLKQFSVVFERDFADEGNSVVREIRENCCLGAVITLYYYATWHMLLIMLNSSASVLPERRF